MKRIFVSGYYGYKNLGDDYILASMMDQLSELKDSHIIVEITN